MNKSTCAFCGRWPVEEAHVKPIPECKPEEENDSSNIINLCPTCHYRMDECYQIALSADGSVYLLMTPSNDIEMRKTERQYNVSNEYIEERNAKAKLTLKQEMSSRTDEEGSSWPIKP